DQVVSRRVAHALVATLVGMTAIAGAALAQDADAVWAALRTPGAVIVLRHSYAPGGFDPPGARLDDCSTQRNLDDNGRAQARRIGEAFREHGISVGKSSPARAAVAWTPGASRSDRRSHGRRFRVRSA